MNKIPDKYNETFTTWNKVAYLYEEKFMNLNLYNNTYDTFCELIKIKNPKILEVGCGPGNITKYILSKRPDFKILGLDISPNMIKLAKYNNPTAAFKEMDIRQIGQIKTKFDAIICGFILPYLSKSDRIKLIEDCGNLLSEKGLLYISFIEGNHGKSGFQTGSDGSRVYLYYHEIQNLKSELITNGFKILNIEKVDYKKQISSEKHIIIIAKLA